MINKTTESNQSFASELEMGEKVSPDFFLFQLLIILARKKRWNEILCQFHLNFHNL